MHRSSPRLMREAYSLDPDKPKRRGDPLLAISYRGVKKGKSLRQQPPLYRAQMAAQAIMNLGYNMMFDLAMPDSRHRAVAALDEVSRNVDLIKKLRGSLSGMEPV